MLDHNQTVEEEVGLGFLKKEKKNKAGPKSERACVLYGAGEGTGPLNENAVETQLKGWRSEIREVGVVDRKRM